MHVDQTWENTHPLHITAAILGKCNYEQGCCCGSNRVPDNSYVEVLSLTVPKTLTLFENTVIADVIS